MKRIPQMNGNKISVNLCISVSSAVKKTVVLEPQITRMKRMAQMKRNSISVEPKVRNLRTSVSSAVKKNSCLGTADYADEKDAADEENQHQRRTEGSQSVSSAVKEQLFRNHRLRG
jgi:hypothetical protein